jgi:hypothetical protein
LEGRFLFTHKGSNTFSQHNLIDGKKTAPQIKFESNAFHVFEKNEINVN